MCISEQLSQLLNASLYRDKTLNTFLKNDEWTSYDKKSKKFTKEFNLGDGKYIISFDDFSIKDDVDGDIFNKIYSIDFAKIEDGEAVRTMTNTGNAFNIFGVMNQMIEKFLLRNDVVKPNGFFFTANEPSRRKLYDRYSNTIKTKYGNQYTRVGDCKKFNMFRDYDDDSIFLFMKNDIYKKARLYK